MTINTTRTFEFAFKVDVALSSTPGPVLIERHRRVLNTYDSEWADGRTPAELLFEQDFEDVVYEEALAYFYGAGEVSYWDLYYQWSTSAPQEVGVVIVEHGYKFDKEEMKEYENLEFAGNVTVTVSIVRPT